MTARNRKPNGFGKKKQKNLFLRILPLVLASAALAAAPPAMAQTITLSLDPASVAEDAGATTVTVTAALEETRSTATEVTVSRTGGTATSGTDYAAVNAFTVTIPAEQTSVSGTFTFTPTDDSLAEGDETLVLSGSATGLTPGTATLTITDDDMASTALELSLSPSRVWESAGETTITMTVALNGAARSTATNVRMYPRGGTASEDDFPGLFLFIVRGLTIPANETSATRTFTMTPLDDSLREPPETVIMRVWAGDETGLAEDTATLVILDDDAASAITLSVSPEWVAEDAGATTVTVTAGLDAGTRRTATEVTVSRTGGTATSGTDYAAVDAFTVTIPAEQTSGTATFTFTPTDDSAAEGVETVILSGSATGLTTGTATLTITDDDSVPTNILLSVSQVSVAETAGATTVTVTVALDAGTRNTATNVLVLPTGGTATSGTDYAVFSVTLTIPAEQESATATFTFTPTDDSLREAPETVILGAGVLGEASLADWTDTATLTITDDDAAALVTLSVSPEGVWEHLGAETVTVTAALLEAARATATEVTVSRTGGTAISGTDYAAVQDFTVTIPAEQTSGTATFTLTPTDNSAEEPTKMVILGERVRGRTLNTVLVRLEILDDESTRRAIVLRASPRSVEEHAGATTVTVTATLVTERQNLGGGIELVQRARPFATEVTVSRTGGTATSGTDYAAVEDFTLTIPAQQESGTATFTFTPTDDEAQEGNETVILSASGEALVFRSDEAQTFRSTTLTIADDDTYVNANWPGIPPGLTTGDRFRLLFVTAAGRAPTSTGISGYNTYVQGQADTDSVHDAIRTHSSHFRVLGSAEDVSVSSVFGSIRTNSTDSTDARDNTWTTYTDGHKGVPIYWLGGNKVADDYEDFYDGDWDDEANPTDGSGQVIAAEEVWTGSNSDGTARPEDANSSGNSYRYWRLGDSTVGYGVLNGDGAGGPISGGIDDDTNTDKGYYALSGVFRVGTTTVDPTGIALSVSPGSVYEDGGATTVTVTATLNLGTRTTATEVTVSRTGGTATSGTDYEAVENFTVTIPANQISGTATFTFTPTDDDAVESADETVILSGSAPGLTSGTATLTITDDDKLKPVFPDSAKARSVAENTAFGENVGAPVAATSPNNSALHYIQGGADGPLFGLRSETGQILTSKPLDHEADDTLEVTVTAQDANGRSATVDVTITVTDVDEPPKTPAPPTVRGLAADSVQVNWTAPENTGPAISDYDVRYQADGSESWIELGHEGTGLSTTVTGLAAGTYSAQVRATNPEGTSDWSPSGTGTTKVSATEVPSDWSLAPSGLAAGDTFRLLFHSSVTRDATSTDIGDYNTFVQGAAAAGHDDIQAYSAGFRAVASTADVDARGNTDTIYAEDDKGPPIYWLGGAQLADHYEDFYDGSWDEVATGRGEAGTSVSFPQYDSNNTVWTGSERDGTEAMDSNGNSSALGTDNPVVGLLNFPFISQYGPLDGDRSETKASLNPLYGLSEVFQIAAVAAMNSAPTFANNMEARSVAENSAAETNVGAVVTASDTDVGDTLEYSLEGTDAAEFDIVATSGQIQTKAALDHEADASYSVTVKAEDGHGGSATVPVTITVTDVNEQPSRPTAPSVTATDGSTTSLDVSWTAPGLNGGPALTGYKLRYRKGSGNWTERSGTETGTSTMIASLDASSEYEVQVRALNGETPSDWSPAGTGTTGTPNSAPTFANASETRSVAENTGAGESVGAVVAASDDDTGDMLTYSLEGTDAAEFDIVATSGQIQTKSALDYETDPSYSVTVKAEDGHGGSATIAVTITVTDVAEQPETPAAPTVAATAGSTTSLDVAWTAPGRNGGPELTGYKLQYRKGGSGSWTEPSGTETGTSATIASLDANSEYQVQVRALNGETPSAWSPTGTGSTRENSAPTFANNMEPRSVAENTGAGESVGAVVAASDTDVGDTLEYSLEGTDAAEFDIVSTSGQIQTKSALDHETDPSYSVTVKAEDDHGGSATVAVTITVTDVAEQPETPAAPTVAATANTTTSLDVSWTAPGRNGGPALTGYALQYRKGGSGPWNSFSHSGTGASATIGSLDVHSEYQVQVRALNGETPSAWSPTGTGSTGNSLPVFGGTPPLARSVAENTGAGESVGAVVAASDDDTGDMLTYSLEGTDAAEFDIVATSGQIQTKSALDYETDPSYSVTVKAEDGHGGSATIAVTITVTDVAEQPETPAAPTVAATAGSTTSLDVAWTAPGRNGGPELTGYKLQYRKGGSGSWTEPSGTETGTSATIASLDANSEYQVQVRALNGETPSAWSPTGTGSTRENSAPTFANNMEPRSVAENTGAGESVGAVVAASDTDVGDTLTYSLEGTDAAEFDIVSTSGQIQTKSALDHETDPSYSVTVKAEDDHGGSATVAVTITVTDVAEQPETPAAPTVAATANTTTSLDVSWTAPGRNGGPALTGYKLRYRKGSGNWTERSGTETGTSTMIASLDASSEYEVQVRALNGETPSDWSPHGTGTTGTPNSAPTFANETETRSVAENTAAGENVGAVVTASDTDVGDTLTYSLEGTNAASFDIVSTSGQIRTKAALDHETDASYSVTVKAEDGNGGSATVAVTITVTDVDEQPETPTAPSATAPSVTATSGSTTSLDVAWTAPGTNGGPALTGYEVQYRKVPATVWTAWTGTVTGTSATIASLDASSEYQVQVRALNGETPSAWSPAGTGSTGNSLPVFGDTPPVGRSVAENAAPETNVGAVVAATDADTGDTLSYSLEGTDATSFSIVSTSGQIQTKSGVTLDHEADDSYSVTVKAEDGHGGSATIAVTITVTDVAEQPETPAAPTVAATSGSTTSLDVAWTAPGLNGGPALTGYKLRYRKGSGNWTERSGTETGTSAMIGSLDANSSYQVQVRALNGETPSAWSPSGTGSTRANSAPTFANNMEARSVAENTAAGQNVGAVVAASDTDVGDTLSYSLEGTDAASFDIVSTSGQIQTKAALDHETDASYSVTVKADDGHGGSATVAVTITVTDVDEQPETPTAPTVAATANTTTSLDVSWTAPGTNGGPALTGYEVQYRKVPATVWTAWTGTVTGTSATIASLDASSEYQVQVRALNGETPSDWSPHGSGTTGTPNSAPTFANNMEARSVAENTASGEDVGAVVAASDTDVGDTLTYSLEGTNAASFDIVSTSGQIQTKSGVTYDHEAKSSYSVTVKADDGNGGSDTVPVAITVTDVAEQPETPTAPSVTATSGSTTSLDVAWTAPGLNGGPALTGYEVQYRKGSSGSWIAHSHSGTGTSTTIASLDASSEYQVQVRALNGETPSAWSPAGSGTTGTPNSALTVGMASGTDPPVSGPFTVRFSFSEPVTGFNASDIAVDQDPECRDDQGDLVLCDPGIGVLETTDNRVFTTTVTPGTDRVAHNYTLMLTVPADAVRSSVDNKPNEEATLEVRVAPPGVEEPISSIGLQASSGSVSVRLAWNEPTDPGGSAIIRYEYRYQEVGEAWSEWENVAAGSSGVTVGGLINGQEYVLEVRAVNALGKGGAETVQATPERRIAPPPPGGGGGGGGGGLLFPPEAPLGLMAMAGEGAVRLEWSPPESDGGTAILRYEYRLKEGLGEFGEWTPIEDSAPGEVNASGYTVGKLENGTVYVFELRAVNAAGRGRVSEAVEVMMPLDPAYWSNFRAEDLRGTQLRLDAFFSVGSSGDRELRFGEGLRFKEDELDGEGKVTATHSGSYGYRYTSRTTGELSLDFDGGEACELRLTFSGEGAGSYRYRCGGSSRGQGSFELSELVNRVPEITSLGPFEVEENTARVGQLEAVDWDEEDEVTGYATAGGADGALFTVDEQTGELSFTEAPDFENPEDVASEDPHSAAGDNEYILVVEVTSGEGERERTREQAIRVWVRDVEMDEAGEEERESLFIPVILSSAGRNQSFFTSELTLTNRGDEEVELHYTYTAEAGGGSGTASDVLPSGSQNIETDALTYLRGLGTPIPEDGNRIGTLRVEAPLKSEVEAVVRTTTLVPDGRAGLAYLGVAEEEGFTGAVYLCGLRQNSQDRSNVAIQHMGRLEEGSIRVRATVFSGDPETSGGHVLEDRTLLPGRFYQYNGILDMAGFDNGYVKVERVEGEAPFYAYGVINDQANSDGSFVFPVTAGSLQGTRGQTLPVIVETSEFRSELTVTNFSEEPRTLDFEFVAEGIEATGNTVSFHMTLEAGQQEIIPDVVDELRGQQVAGLGTTGGFYAGPLFVVAKGGDMSGIVIGARTGSEGGGGSYSVFYNAVPEGEAFTQEAWVDGLQQNEENRSNLALVNTGEVDGSDSVFHLEIYDGETGMLVETVVTRQVPARRWHQINGILGSYAPETRQGYIRILKVSGENPFLAYGVVNDGGTPGERSGDGAYVPARE